MKAIFYILLYFSLPIATFCQEIFVQVDEIEIEGNHRCKSSLIKRELDFEEGDSIKLIDLMTRFKVNESYILNMKLFTFAQLNVVKWETNNVVVKIKVRERFFLVPIFLWELADRNFNVWWSDYNHDIKRVNFGLRLDWLSLTKNNDLLITTGQFGFTNKYEVKYKFPWIDPAKKWGLHGQFLYTHGREVPYLNQDNKQIFFRDLNAKKSLSTRTQIDLGAHFRNKLFVEHEWDLFYLNLGVQADILQLNANYFLNKSIVEQSFNLKYSFKLDKRNFKTYASKGYYFRASLFKEGLGIFNHVNQLTLTLNYQPHFKINNKVHLSSFNEFTIKFNRKEQAYLKQKALGYRHQFVRGYQMYVIDGYDYAFTRNDIHFRLFDKAITWEKSFLKIFHYFPLQAYARGYIDAGFVRHPYIENKEALENKVLLGYGIGLDVVFLLNAVLQFEYSFNKRGENGFYLRNKILF